MFYILQHKVYIGKQTGRNVVKKFLQINFATLFVAAVIGTLSVTGGSICHGSNGFAYAQAANSDSTLAEESLDDGPHIFLADDSSAIVFYLCHGSVNRRSFDPVDTLRFFGFCRDSAMEYIVPLEPPAIEPHIFTDVSRIFAVSDIHGEYEYLVDILINGRVIDQNLHWAWGDGHLVVVGDIFDRGDRVTECLWFIYRLEQEAKLAGGRVHFTLGNHEMMVMRGDNRYIHQRYLEGIVRKTRIRHEDLYGPDMVLGRWLRSKHTAIKINDIIFIHAGIPPFFTERGLSLDSVNKMARDNMDLRSSQLAFNDFVKLLYGSVGPFWYRGYFEERENRYPMATQDHIDSTLSHYDAHAIVVGHSGVDQVSGLFANKVLALDVPFEDLGSLQALLWQDDKFYRVTGAGELQPIE